MSSLELISFPDPQALARTVADQWLKDLESARPGGKRYLVALAGGRIVRLLFEAAVALARGRDPLFGSVHFFWGDERCVPPTDPESNFAIARQLLLTPLNIPEQQVHRIHGEDPPAKAAADAEADLRASAPVHSNGQPILDLVFLGMGEDGHVASLFPGESDQAAANPVVYRPVVASKPPPQRITIGYPALAAATQVWVLASGPGKETALNDSLAPSGRTPLAKVLKSRARTRVFTDIRMEKG